MNQREYILYSNIENTFNEIIKHYNEQFIEYQDRNRAYQIFETAAEEYQATQDKIATEMNGLKDQIRNMGNEKLTKFFNENKAKYVQAQESILSALKRRELKDLGGSKVQNKEIERKMEEGRHILTQEIEKNEFPLEEINEEISQFMNQG